MYTVCRSYLSNPNLEILRPDFAFAFTTIKQQFFFYTRLLFHASQAEFVTKYSNIFVKGKILTN